MTDERIEMLLQKYKEYEVSDEGYAVLSKAKYEKGSMEVKL